MTDILEKLPHDIRREKLQNHLATTDRDPAELQAFIAELYAEQEDNPQILYAAATHLTALTYLDRRNSAKQPTLPDPQHATRAFETYTRLMFMLSIEKDAPLYMNNERVRRRLAGTLEELAFHATFTYATAEGADFVALPAPAELDFTGANEASDVQIFFPGQTTRPLEIQVGYNLDTKAENAYNYHPRIPVLSLASTLGSNSKAAELRGLLKAIGRQDDDPSGQLNVPKRERDILLSGAASILRAAWAWKAPEA